MLLHCLPAETILGVCSLNGHQMAPERSDLTRGSAPFEPKEKTHRGKRRGFTSYRHSLDAGGRDSREAAAFRGNTEQRGPSPRNKTHLSAHQSPSQGQHCRPMGALWMNYGASLALTRSHKECAPRRAEAGAVEEQKDTFYLHRKGSLTAFHGL